MALRLLLGVVEVEPFKQFWVQPPKFIKKFPPGPPEPSSRSVLSTSSSARRPGQKVRKVFTFVRRRAAFFWLVSWLIYPLGFPSSPYDLSHIEPDVHHPK